MSLKSPSSRSKDWNRKDWWHESESEVSAFQTWEIRTLSSEASNMTMKISIRIRIEALAEELERKWNCHVAEPYMYCSYRGGKTDLVKDIFFQLSKSLLDKFWLIYNWITTQAYKEGRLLPKSKSKCQISQSYQTSSPNSFNSFSLKR